MKKPNTILITGASSGLGAALALQYARAGRTLFLGARNSERLGKVAQKCRNKGAIVMTRLIDVTDTGLMEEWISDSFTEKGLDLVIANAGISAGTLGQGESIKQVKEIFAVNIDGVINTIHPALDKMLSTGKGQIAIISSLSGYRGLPSAPAYSASKAAVKVYGEALRGFYCDKGIKVNVITPGYIKTPMTAVNDFPMPFLLEAGKAAVIIENSLAKDKARIAFPLFFYFFVWLLSILPPAITDHIFKRLPKKSSFKNDA